MGLVAFSIAIKYWKKAESTTEPIAVEFRTLRNELRISLCSYLIHKGKNDTCWATGVPSNVARQPF